MPLSRLTDLIAHAKAKDPQLGADLDKEFKVLSARLPFGLNFERHRPEAVELPLRLIRKSDKVRVLPPRGSTKKGDPRLWLVKGIRRTGDGRVADLELLGVAKSETQSVSVDDLAVVAEFRDTVYPGLVSTGKVECGGDKPFHTVINGENYHVLKALTYTHRGKIDAIYIDPPYNTGAKDWKYNNDYVEGDDLYRHSKWLAMMERRLLLAKDLLNPDSSMLIVTVDEKEYLRLGLLLEQTFPEGNVQMVSSVINRKGVVRTNELTRTNEFIFFVKFGSARLAAERERSTKKKVRWASLRRFEDSSRRSGPQPRPDQFYPIFIGIDSQRIESIGTSLPAGVDRTTVPAEPGCVTVWPLKPDGTEMIWGLTPSSLQKRLSEGFVKVIRGKRGKTPTIYYLTSGQVAEVSSGELVITGRDSDGSVVVGFATGKASLPSTQWDRESHNAQPNGTGLLAALLPNRKFPYAKSLYAVEDCLRLAVGEKRDAVVLDFFSGSGTTAHAVMRLNRQDGGRRQSICITNNEVAATEHETLRKNGLRPGDVEWEKWGICDYITKPRVLASITGSTPDGTPLEGDYKFGDEFPMAEGFKENAEFFTLTYESPLAVNHNVAFSRIAPLLWLRAGSREKRIDKLPIEGWAVVDSYGVLVDVDTATPFIKALNKTTGFRIAFIVTDDDRRFQSVGRRLPGGVEPVRLYESYLSNFSFANGE
jgi:adenine-specific DNA-methyltransferase